VRSTTRHLPLASLLRPLPTNRELVSTSLHQQSVKTAAYTRHGLGVDAIPIEQRMGTFRGVGLE
jgi:hypothetical protein